MRNVKCHPGFPERFGCIEEVRDFCRGFFQWYNTEHRHGGIGLLTPQQVYLGRAREVIRNRQTCWPRPTPPGPTASWVVRRRPRPASLAFAKED